MVRPSPSANRRRTQELLEVKLHELEVGAPAVRAAADCRSTHPIGHGSQLTAKPSRSRDGGNSANHRGDGRGTYLQLMQFDLEQLLRATTVR